MPKKIYSPENIIGKLRKGELGSQRIERRSIGNLKQTWVTAGQRNWSEPALGEGREFLRRATQVKNLWVPYGE